MNTRAKIVDDLINIVFKLDVMLPDEVTIPIRSMDPYYDWLLNIDQFDYTKFRFEWLTYYETKYYRKRKSQSARLKKHLEDLLQDSLDGDIAKLYVDLFVRS